MAHELSIAFLIGVLTAAPGGPVGLISLHRAMSRGALTGFVSALGAALADGMWSFVAVHGLSSVSHWIQAERARLEILIGACFLLYGLNGFFNAPRTSYPDVDRRGRAGAFVSTFLIVFLNPATVIMFSALFTISGITRQKATLVESLEVAGAVMAGATSLWLVATQVLRATRGRLGDDGLRRLTRLSSIVIACFGLGILLAGAW